VQLFAAFHRPLPIGIAENLLNVIRERVLSEERGESDITLNEKYHESQNVKACCHENLVKTEKVANTVTTDLVMADFTRRILKTAEPKSIIPESKSNLQSKPFHFSNDITNHRASLDMAERNNRNCNYAKAGTANDLPVIAKMRESSFKTTANVAHYPVKAVLMIITLIPTSLI
jgi:hypothetical protein